VILVQRLFAPKRTKLHQKYDHPSMRPNRIELLAAVIALIAAVIELTAKFI